MNKAPFFSIVIPTFNREKELISAIKSILNQSCKNFEIVIIDNSSVKKTPQFLIKILNNKKILYIKNKKNLGWINNVSKGISLSKGKYIILHGDDDFLLFNNSLFKLKEFLEKNNYGFVRLNYLSQLKWLNKYVDFRDGKEIPALSISKGRENLEVIEFIEKVDPFFITGILFKNDFPKNIKIIKSELAPWFNIIFFNIKKYGGCYLKDYYFIANWPRRDKNPYHPFNYLVHGKFTFEKYFEEIRKLTKEKEGNEIVKKRAMDIVRLFPANKYSNNNKNLIVCAKRVIKLVPGMKYSFWFWFWLISSFITPDIILKICRNIYIHNLDKRIKVKGIRKIRKRVNLLEEII